MTVLNMRRGTMEPQQRLVLQMLDGVVAPHDR